MTVLRISLLGMSQIGHDNWKVQVTPSPKAWSLLAYLLLQGPRYHSREQLAEALWYESPPAKARNSLRTTLWRLRQSLEPNTVAQGTYLLTTANDEIGFNWDSEHWFDVAAFESQTQKFLAKAPLSLQPAEVKTLTEAISLYKGDLLQGYYDDWAIREQERLRSHYLNCLEKLMYYHQYHDFFEKSILFGQRILEFEPTHEDIHREVMRNYLASGQRTRAVQQYESCCQILAQELDLSPMPETQALYQQARLAGNALPPPAKPPKLLAQLSQASQGFRQAQQEFKQAQASFEQAQQHLQRALRLFDQLK